MKHVAIIGSTGSIGTQTLEIARWNQDIKICALSAGRNIDLLEKQAREFRPEIVGLWDEKLADELKDRLKDMDIRVVSGMDGLIEIAEYKTSDILVTAIVGMIGIRPTVAAIKAGKDIALANKETLVTAGHIIMPLAKEKGVSILPVDSEHSAIFQSLQGNTHDSIKKILLTASGGSIIFLSSAGNCPLGDSGDGGDGSFGMPPADCRNCHPYPLHDGSFLPLLPQMPLHPPSLHLLRNKY